MKLLEGKVALITGAARGIGKAIALKYASEGANIAFTDLVINEAAEETVKELEAFGVNVKAYASNAADFEATQTVVEQIVKDFSEYFRTLLLIRKGVKSENVLGEQVSSFPADILNAYNEEQLEAALDMFLNLYRDIRYSLNPRFELELAISKLSRLRYVASNASVLEQLARLKNDLISGAITPLNPDLADQKTIQPQASEPKPQSPAPAPAAPSPAPEKAEEKPEIQTPPVPEPEQPEQPKEVSEPQPVEEAPAPAPAAVQEKSVEWTLEGLADALPHGTISVEKTDMGLVLGFNSRLFYQTANRNKAMVE